jgi:hypothetical protein
MGAGFGEFKLVHAITFDPEGFGVYGLARKVAAQCAVIVKGKVAGAFTWNDAVAYINRKRLKGATVALYADVTASTLPAYQTTIDGRGLWGFTCAASGGSITVRNVPRSGELSGIGNLTLLNVDASGATITTTTLSVYGSVKASLIFTNKCTLNDKASLTVNHHLLGRYVYSEDFELVLNGVSSLAAAAQLSSPPWVHTEGWLTLSGSGRCNLSYAGTEDVSTLGGRIVFGPLHDGYLDLFLTRFRPAGNLVDFRLAKEGSKQVKLIKMN